MKKATLLLALLTIAILSHAQIIKEHDYTGSTTFVKLANSGEKYYTMDLTKNQCQLYNTDHSQWKVINLTIPAGTYLYDISHVSETLFNLDDKVELAYVYYAYDTVLYYYTYTTRVINEDGLELLSIPGASYSEVKSLSGIVTKLLAWVYDYSVLPYTVHTMVYSLPGQGASDGPGLDGKSNKAAPAYPNPARETVTIPYTLPEGTNTGEISVADGKGMIVRTYAIGRAFHDLQISTAGWPGGTYYYRIKTGNQVSPAGKFIIE
jgi:hypothetical protein